MFQDNQRLSVEDLCRKLKPIFGNKITDLYLRYSMTDSRDEKEEIASMINGLYFKYFNSPLNKTVLLEPPKEELVQGQYPIAVVSYAGKKLYPFRLREQDWPRHVCISGMSGSGKTNLAFHVIQNFINYNKPFLVFDWKKSFRPLINADPELRIFTIGDDKVSNSFKININEPPKGVPPKEWINVLCDLLTESFFVSFGVHKILLETLDESFKEWGIYNGSNNYPTWNHIKWRLEQKLDAAKGRESTWLESALRIATVLTFGEFGKICNYKGEDGYTVEDVTDKKIILELNSLGNIEKKFFCEFVLTYLYKLKKVKQNKINEGFNHAIIVDEAHNIFLKDKTHFVKESVTDMIYREMREYGTALVCLDQHISKLSDTVRGNSACHIAFQQQLPEDIQDISELMQIKDKKDYFSNLPVGTAIVRLSERHNFPFLVEVPFAQLRNQLISDEEVANRMNTITMGENVKENPDSEFNRALVGKLTLTKPIEEQEQPDKNNWTGLTDEQNDIYSVIHQKLAGRESLMDIERYLDSLNRYDSLDIIKAINYVFEEQLKNKINVKKPIEKISEAKPEVSQSIPQIVPQEQSESERFLSFIKDNNNHSRSTIEIYKLLNLSARKGNKIKDQLLKNGSIKIVEEKNSKGWKKIIRLA